MSEPRDTAKDAEVVKRVRYWLDSGKERDIDMRDLRRVCHLAETSLRSEMAAISASGMRLRLFGTSGPHGSIAGIEIHGDRALPDDVVELRDGITGRVLGRIINVGRE